MTQGPRDKISRGGTSCATDAELVSAIIGFGNKKYDYAKLSSKIISQLRNTISEGEQIERANISSIYGIGRAKSIAIFAGIELGRRLYGDYSERIVINSSKAAFEQVSFIANKKQEYLIAIYLDARFCKIATRTIAVGSINTLAVKPRDIIAPSLTLNAASILVAHNHPSGDVTPSPDDIDMTKRIKQACDIMGIKLLDHLIVHGKRWQSIF